MRCLSIAKWKSLQHHRNWLLNVEHSYYVNRIKYEKRSRYNNTILDQFFKTYLEAQQNENANIN